MVFYAIGSLLFVAALVAASSVIIANFVHYRAQMLAALRTLSLDSVHEHKPTAFDPYPSGPAVRTRLDRPGRPAPRLAA
ncbi:MAG: hypothetical protein J7485_13855 [Sphingobium sp.]|nr:hypothetical protein [Sphingobium sp.]